MNENKETKIAVIGPTQSGKTCLAVGFRAVNIDGVVSVKPFDEEVRKYIDDLKIALCPMKDEQGILRPGSWPEASNLGTDKALRFEILKTGKDPIIVEFPEYSGEMLRPEKFTSFANKYLRGLRGVVLLVNPGADAFQKGNQQLFEDVMAQYDQVLTYLRDENNDSEEAFVALTVTAADRLRGDLKGKLELFDECLSRLSNTLKTSGCRWKRFNVTITGHLERQDNPTLAKGRKNSAAKPFLWLLDKLHWLPIRQKIMSQARNIFFAIAGILVLGSIGFGVHAWNVLENIDKDKAKLENEIYNCRNEASLEDIKKLLVALQSRSGLFAEKAKSHAAALEPMVWNAFETQINKVMNDIRGDPEKKGSPKDCNSVDSIFTLWIPQCAECKKKHSDLKAKWEKEKPKCQERYAIAQMNELFAKKLDELTATHGEEVVRSLYILSKQLKDINPCSDDTRTRKEELLKLLDERVAKEFKEHLIPKFQDNRKLTKEEIEQQAKQLHDLLSDWTPHGEAYREIRDSIKEKLVNVTTKKSEDWVLRKKKECVDWIEREITSRQSREGYQLVREYIREKRIRWDHESIFNETIRSAVYSYCETCFDEDIEFFQRYYHNKAECEKRFESFKQLCKEIVDAKDPDNISWAIRFARGCVDTGRVEDGFKNAFIEIFEIVSAKGEINYCGKNPLDGFQGTQFGLTYFRKSSEDRPDTIIEQDESPVVKSNDNVGIDLKCPVGLHVSASFANPLYFAMSVHDDRNWEIDYRKDYKDDDVDRENFCKWVDPFCNNLSDEFPIKLGGWFGEQTEDRQLAAYMQVNLRRVSGLGICALLRKAKEDHNAAHKSNK